MVSIVGPSTKADHSPGIYVYIYGEKIYVYIYFLGSFGNLASLGSRMNGKWKLHGERPALKLKKELGAYAPLTPFDLCFD